MNHLITRKQFIGTALAADDLYVRARVESDAPTKFKRKRCLHPAHHTAWTQPYSLVES